MIATGETNTLQEFVSETFTALDLDWQEHVEQKREFMRPTDLLIGRADPGKAEQVLGWKAQAKMREVIRMMLAGISD